MAIQAFELADFGWSPFFHSQLQDDEITHAIPARVMAVDRARLHLQAPALEIHSPPFFAEDGAAATVGDWLLLDAKHRPLRLLRRKSAFKRVAPGTGHEIQFIAANIDTVFVVTSCNQDFNIARLERYLALAREAEVTPVIVLTKADLAESPATFMDDALKVRAGVHVEAVNALDARDVERLAAWCGRGQTVALLGSSGVGKSTLVGTLTGTALATQAVREDARFALAQSSAVARGVRSTQTNSSDVLDDLARGLGHATSVIEHVRLRALDALRVRWR